MLRGLQASLHARSPSMDPRLRVLALLSLPRSSPTEETPGNTPQCCFVYLLLCTSSLSFDLHVSTKLPNMCTYFLDIQTQHINSSYYHPQPSSYPNFPFSGHCMALPITQAQISKSSSLLLPLTTPPPPNHESPGCVIVPSP